ncbi:N-formylglutamate amidohydrolase [Rufibacter latericius]|uniref:N-formylglutamate amidohydrolase n=1 Tax=Rufibacter latericius TaxID=2487040 RepID=A0A3M9MVQ4_9BACT|nr:N-formylglutamate amidohydrolase [Rufibacter latericius]RNI29197.1 N-formylglutamate amidohydrolase [Rufibacter latericius]
MTTTCILTCEHAGNDIPQKYESLYKGKEEVLYSHKAMDFGALRLAKHLAQELGLPLFYTTTSRLLVEGNRSLDNEELFSEYTRQLSEKEKQEILEQYYFPHRNEVEEKVRAQVEAGEKVLHLAVHTFTPVKEGEVREAEIGILFDPDRSWEKEVAARLKAELSNQNPGRKVLDNSPYPGVDDGLPTYLRTKFNNDQYAGFELEINQKLFLHGEPEVWQQVLHEMAAALKVILNKK